MTLPIGAALQNGHYVLDSVTHQDESGTTYRGTHVLSGQVVSIQLLGETLPRYLESFLLRAEFIDQIQRLAQLQHPNIVGNLHCFEEDGLLFVAMAADVGLSLAQIVGSNRPLPETVALNFLYQIAGALAAIRQVGLKHLDLDPRVIFRKSGTNRMVLTGFGFSLGSLADKKFLPNNLPPPRWDSYPANAPQLPVLKTSNSDIYKLAALLYYLLSGQLIAPDRQRGAELSWPQRRTDISKATKQAIQLGLGLPNQVSIAALKEWLTFLPNVGGASSEDQIEPPVFIPEEDDRPRDDSMDGLDSPTIVFASPVKSKTTPRRSIPSAATNQPQFRVPTTAPPPSDLQLVKSVETVKPVKSVETVKPVKSVETVKPVKSVETVKPVKSVETVKPGSRIRNLALLMTVFVSALTGLGFGAALRFRPSSQPGRIRFDPDQSFPPLEDWVEDQPAVDFDSPYLPSEESLSGRPRSRRINLDPPRADPSNPEPTDKQTRKDSEFNWLEQESVIPDYPDLKQPRSSFGAWPTYPETANPSSNAPESVQPALPDASPFPSVLPNPSSEISETSETSETSPLKIPEASEDSVDSSSELELDQLAPPIPAPAPIVEPSTTLLERAEETIEPAESSPED